MSDEPVNGTDGDKIIERVISIARQVATANDAPCPWCGFETIGYHNLDNEGTQAGVCMACSAHGPPAPGTEKARDAWNRRGALAFPSAIPYGSFRWNPWEEGAQNVSTPSPHEPQRRFMVSLASGLVAHQARFYNGTFLVPPQWVLKEIEDSQGARKPVWDLERVDPKDRVIAWSLEPHPYAG
jgi:hypothetical protein